MNIRHPFVKLVALGALAVTLPALMAPSGGYPTRPQFQSTRVGTGLADPGTNNSHVHGTETADGGFVGNLTGNATTATTATTATNATNVSGGTVSGTIGTLSGTLTGHSSLDLPLTGGSLSGPLTINGSGQNLVSVGTGAVDIYTLVNVSGFSYCGTEVNNSGSVSSTGMPAGQSGFLCFGNVFVHTGGGTFATDATTVPWVAASTSGSGTLTYTSGCTSSSIAPTFTYVITGKMVALTLAGGTCPMASNPTLVLGSLPAAIQPASTHVVVTPMTTNVSTFGVAEPPECTFGATAAISCALVAAAGTTGFPAGATIVYPLN